MAEDPQSTKASQTTLALTEDVRLPDSYRKARKALERCTNVDECRAWSDKAAAMASYALMSDDKQLFQMARRVQAIAARRGGELLKELDARPQNASKTKCSEGYFVVPEGCSEPRGPLEKKKRHNHTRSKRARETIRIGGRERRAAECSLVGEARHKVTQLCPDAACGLPYRSQTCAGVHARQTASVRGGRSRAQHQGTQGLRKSIRASPSR